MIVENHRLAANRIARRPRQSRLAGIAGAREIGPGGGHLFRQRLRLGRVAGALAAEPGIVEAESEFGGMPGARLAIELRRLPGEPILISRRGMLVVLELDHALNIVALAIAA